MAKFRPVQLSLPYDGSVRDLVERAEWLEFVFPFTVRTIDANGRCSSSIQRASIVLTSARNDTATVVIESSGQISVQ